MDIDKAREILVKNHKSEYKNYITNHLAGDFAVELANNNILAINNNLILLMQSALIEAHNHGHSAGLQWIFNYLEASGNIPDMDGPCATEYYNENKIKLTP